ncbi:hypothetical protein GSI_12406 [Ganoderma sinense ZZ0214-1]|uniref:Uncharacterized protein n=1 Tax=Ganoderma sinense ZZ0214-1 TaxID=1077348 RepID=A0A2G8RVI9_9APHY|nr:hypothetical protein GSI_12406 [Ganoderma sinense ZZ0214-1]
MVNLMLEPLKGLANLKDLEDQVVEDWEVEDLEDQVAEDLADREAEDLVDQEEKTLPDHLEDLLDLEITLAHLDLDLRCLTPHSREANVILYGRTQYQLLETEQDQPAPSKPKSSNLARM